MADMVKAPDFLKDFSKTFKRSRILITGGTGFLGQRLALVLKSLDCSVTAVGSQEADLRDADQARELFSRRFDIVIHAAAVQGGLEFILSKPAKIFLDNQQINTNIINACYKYPPQKLIGIGSSCAYPGNRLLLQEEDFWNGRMEESVFSYGFTKKTLYVGQYSLFKEIGLKGAHLVFNSLYGIGDNFDPKYSHVVAALIKKFSEAKKKKTPVIIWGDGNAEREVLYVDDAVEGIIRAIMKIDGFELLNIGNGRSFTIKKLAEIIASVFNYHNLRFDAKKPTGAVLKSLSPKKCAALLGWVPCTGLEDGIRKTVSWYLKNKLEAE